MSNEINSEHSAPIALEAYEILAEAYAAAVETKPHNAFYDRPATLSLLPKIAGKKILDAGCGPGVYAAHLLKSGAAQVTAIDASPKMIELTKQKLGESVDARVADLSKPLDFLADDSFDVVLSPLVLDYVEDWRGTFGEFYRILRRGGHFVFSSGHPFSDYLYFKTEDYFATEIVSCEWSGFPGVRVQMPGFRRPLSELLNPLIEAGFQIEKLLEPLPTEEFKKADPQRYEKLLKFPTFVCVRARK